MEFNVKSGTPEKQRSACIVLGVYESRRLTPQAEQVDRASNGYLSQILRSGDMEGKLGQTLFLYQVPNILTERILLIGCGKEREFSENEYQQVITTAIQTLHTTGSLEAVNFLSNLHVKGHNTYWNIRQAVEITSNSLYRFDQFKSQVEAPRRPLKKLTFALASRKELAIGEEALQHALAISQAQRIAKNLVNMPGNIATPSYLAQQALGLAEATDNIECKIIGEKEMHSLGMHAYLAVSQGSEQEAQLAMLSYQGAPDRELAPIVLIGKGVTFDSGGLSLKSASGMAHMKYDMGGAASVYAVMHALSQLQLPLNVIGLIAGVENMPSASAYRPSDVITSMSGLSIEIINTDAEGRLILCDTLTYAQTFNPELMIDVATLTGSCIEALGHHMSALLSNNNGLAHELVRAGEEARDPAWQLPLNSDYQAQIESEIADIKNVGCDGAGAITAGCFLSRFTNKYPWAHIDIAGSAWKSAKPHLGATGRPCALLIQYLLNKVERD